MLDISFISQNPDLVKKAVKSKNVDDKLVDQLLKVDQQRRKLIGKIESLRAEKNQLSREQVKEARQIKVELQALGSKLSELLEKYNGLLYQIPNLPAEDVCLGQDESGNETLRKWGKIPEFGFKPQDHLSLGEKLGLIDMASAAKVSGSRFGYVKNEAVLLEFALIQYAFKLLLKQGFIPVLPPVLVKDEMMKGMGYLEHGGNQETYHLDKDGLYLIGTSEQSIGPMHAGDTFSQSKLPLRYMSFSSCFRREAGSYGRDTRGIFRVHQFDKLEMFCFTLPSESDKEHDYLLSLEEKLVQDLKLPYRVVKMCSGDLGYPAARKYDIETWLPLQDKYRETHSVSSCTDFQSRRLNIKYRKKDNSTGFVHTLNGTVFSQRLIIAILENYQQQDGSVKIPKVLQSYIGKKLIKFNQ